MMLRGISGFVPPGADVSSYREYVTSPDAALLDEPRDVADRLPKRARENFQRIRECRDIIRAAASMTLDKYREAHERLTRERYVLDTIVYPPRARRGEKPQSVVAHERVIAKLVSEVEKLTARREDLSEKRQRLGELVRNIETFLDELPRGATILDQEIEPPKVKGEFAAAVETRRRRLRELEADRHRIASAPRPSKVAKELIVAEIDRLADRGAPVVDGAIEVNRSPIDWPTRLHTVEFDPLALTAWLHRDALVKKLCDDVDAIADDANALTDEQRAIALAQIEGDRLATEFEEEVLIRHIEATGGSFERRPDASPQAVLQIMVDLSEADLRPADNIPEN